MGSKYTETQANAQKRYRSKMAHIQLMMQPEEKETIKMHAMACGDTVVGYIRKAIREKMEKDDAGRKNCK